MLLGFPPDMFHVTSLLLAAHHRAQTFLDFINYISKSQAKILDLNKKYLKFFSENAGEAIQLIFSTSITNFERALLKKLDIFSGASGEIGLTLLYYIYHWNNVLLIYRFYSFWQCFQNKSIDKFF